MNVSRPLLTAACLALLSGCASLPYAKVESALRGGDFAAAADTVKAAEKDYGGKARVLYLMDRCMTLHLAGDYAGSNAAIEEASRIIDSLYTKSISSEAGSFLMNDMSLPYRGENYERVMLHLWGMLNYAALGDREGALVEAHKADALLKEFTQDKGPGAVAYREDALARYVSATLYEGGSRQELWDAYLDYKKADEAFDLYLRLYGTPKPRRLKADLQRLAEGLGEKEDLERWRARDGQQDYVPLETTRRDQAELVVLLYDGLAPLKISVSSHLPVSLDDGTQQYFSLALPKALARPLPVPEASLSADGAGEARFELFQDINAIAQNELREKAGALAVKATARALAKFQAARAIQKEAAKAGGGAQIVSFLATNIYGLVSEQADTRGWRTLPGRVYLARLALAPGRRQVRVKVQAGGESRELDLGTQELKAGQKLFLKASLL
jgi:hypothetical protein